MVHIRKVEIFGFKSFGFRNTVVDFRPGLVSISGPNGSGKSNILDAIIFASGEMRPKVMRVDKIRSLIHDVSSSGGGSRMARVSVHFDNSDRKIPFDSDSVEITRELSPDGENTYYINKKKTQRTHVVDLLEMANAGLHQLNAVQQGTVTRISEFTAEEKRHAIEDLVGMSMFDEKKTAAQNQLEAADNKLNVAFATMVQIKKQIDDLELQRNLQMRHVYMQNELARLQAESAAGKIYRLNNTKQEKSQTLLSVSEEINSTKENLGKIRAVIKTVEDEKSQFLAKMNEYNREKAQTDKQLADAMGSFEETRAILAVSKKRTDQIDARTNDLHIQSKNAAKLKDEAKSNLHTKHESLEKLESEKKRIAGNVTSSDERRMKILQRQSAESERRRQVDEKLQEMTSAFHDEELAAIKAKNTLSEYDAKINTNKTKMTQCMQNIEKLQNLKNSVSAIWQGRKDDVQKITSYLNSLKAKKAKAERDLEDLEIILEKSTKAGAKYDSKIQTVRNFMHEDYSVAKLKEHATRLGILGLVYELLSWDKEYERAIMASGSEWIKAIVVKDFETLVALAEHVRAQKLPKVKIIPLDALTTIGNANSEGGPHRMLSSHIRCSNDHRYLAEFLFGSIAVVKSNKEAFEASNSGYKVVTMDGNFVQPHSSGVVIDINSRISKIARIISMSMSVQGLLESVSVLKKHTISKKSAIQKASLRISEREALLRTLVSGMEKAQGSGADLEDSIKNASTLYNSIKERMNVIDKERASSQMQMSECAPKLESLKSEISSLKVSRTGIDIESIEADLQKANKEKSVINVQYSAILEEYGSIFALSAKLDAEILRHDESISLAEKEMQSLASEKITLSERIISLDVQLIDQNKILVSLREGEQRLIEGQGGSASEIEVYDEQTQQMRIKENEFTDSKTKAVRRSDGLNRDISELSIRVDALKKALNSYRGEIAYDPNFDPEPLLRGLDAELRTLGDLNATAPATYVEISTGYRSMSMRKNMLEGERNSIVRFIEDVERDKKQTFLDAFDIVDKQVRETFSMMTSGSAWLELQNEDDIFNSGISYMLQFPNKPKRESTSISGGEKTLAAIVFVLALQKLKPSPFYLFDEVDAHLDAPNAERLSKILEIRSRDSQFIMVSLKDSVVSKASLIYGVYPRKGDAASQVVRYKDKRLPSVDNNS